MTLREALSEYSKTGGGRTCLYEVYLGGPGYFGFSHCCNEKHPNVRYGCKQCPKNCKDFEPLSQRQLKASFDEQLEHHVQYIREKYNIYNFYGYKHPFSNFYFGSFVLWGHKFECGEQAFAWKKAMIFNDTETAQKILATTNPSTCKGLSRRVKNYNDEIWSSVRFLVMYNIVYAKVTQNPEIKELLLTLRGVYIYEDSPYDSVWGVGPDGQGENLLGKVYMEVRDALLEEQK